MLSQSWSGKLYFGKLKRFFHPAAYQIDLLMEKYLPKTGFFIEVGANDGYAQSNTFYLEKVKKWSGVLVEPIPELAKICKLMRPRSHVFQYALVDFMFEGTNVEILFADLMSKIIENQMTSDIELENYKKNLLNKGYTDQVESLLVNARTLTSILEEVNPPQIDFFSLDVEGYELQVLQGLDFSKYRPKYILIEHGDREPIESFLAENNYKHKEKISPDDALYVDLL